MASEPGADAVLDRSIPRENTHAKVVLNSNVKEQNPMLSDGKAYIETVY